MALIDDLKIAPKRISPEGWNYDQSVQKMKPLVARWKSEGIKWRNTTVEMLEGLYRAREAMRNQGVRTDLTSGELTRSWSGYCEDIGFPKRKANDWLSHYLPEEGRKKTPDEIADQRRRIKEAQERLRQREEPNPEEPKTGRTIKELLEEADREINRKEAVNGELKLDGMVENLAQENVFSVIDRYVYSFESTSRQLEAAHNLIKRLKDIISSLQKESTDLQRSG